MPRYLLVVALAFGLGSAAWADYLIVRVVLDGGHGDISSLKPGITLPGADPVPVFMPQPQGNPYQGLSEIEIELMGAPTQSRPEPVPIPAPGQGAAPPPPSGAGDPTRSIVVVVPVLSSEKRTFDTTKGRHQLNPSWDTILHPYGRAYLFTDGSSVEFHHYKDRVAEGVIRERHTAWEKTKDPKQLYTLAVDALATGMTAETITYCDELLKLIGNKKEGLPPELQRFASAYSVVAPKLKSAAAQPANTEMWRDRLAAFSLASGVAQINVQVGNHYALIYWDASNDEVRRRMDQLENNFKNFYLWHSLRGISLPVPEQALVALLPPQAKDVWSLAVALDARSVTTEGFFSPSYGILVLSPGRLDETSRAFQFMMKSVYNNENPADLLKGKSPKIDKDHPPEMAARKLTLAMVDKYLQEDSEREAVSREGTRQILAAIGVLPAHVTMPLWFERGFGSFFERPRGPVFLGLGTTHPEMVLSLTRGTGTPNYVMLKYYRDLADSLELNPKPEELLRNVLTDGYFAAARTVKDIDPDPPHKGPPGRKPTPEIVETPAVLKAREKTMLTHKADATAWALVYYLARTMPEKFYQFGRELDQLPRDLPLDEETLLRSFGRTFGLLHKDGKAIDPQAFKAFATAWVEDMNTVRQNTIDVQIPYADPKAEPPPKKP